MAKERVTDEPVEVVEAAPTYPIEYSITTEQFARELAAEGFVEAGMAFVAELRRNGEGAGKASVWRARFEEFRSRPLR